MQLRRLTESKHPIKYCERLLIHAAASIDLVFVGVEFGSVTHRNVLSYSESDMSKITT